MRKALVIACLLLPVIVNAQVIPTNEWVSFWSDGSTVETDPVPPGAVVRAYDPDGILCGEFTVTASGAYGLMPVYRDDATTPGVDEGAEPGDPISFTIDDVPAVPAGPDSAVWSANGDVKQIDLMAGVFSLNCPPGHEIPPFSTIPVYELVGFRITNTSSEPMAYQYDLESEGPAMLFDNGQPASLSGTTPVLPPGATYYPPAAALRIPTIHESSMQITTYHVSADGYPAVADSCVNIIIFDAPVPVFITRFDAEPSASAVRLTWAIRADEKIKGFDILRRADGSDPPVSVTAGFLLTGDARSFLDGDVQPGRTYEYVLSVIGDSGSEYRSPEIRVTTAKAALELHHNYPNPFNPSTTLAFTIPNETHVHLAVYDPSGSLVGVLKDEVMTAGLHKLRWEARGANGASLSTGVYLYRLEAGGQVVTRKMLLLR